MRIIPVWGAGRSIVDTNCGVKDAVEYQCGERAL